MTVRQIAVDRREATVGGDALARVLRRVELAEAGAPGTGIVNLDDEDRAGCREQAGGAFKHESFGALYINFQQRRRRVSGFDEGTKRCDPMVPIRVTGP